MCRILNYGWACRVNLCFRRWFRGPQLLGFSFCLLGSPVNPCELHCRPEDEYFAEKLRDAVIDGTPCYEMNASRDMCINGICKVGPVPGPCGEGARGPPVLGEARVGAETHPLGEPRPPSPTHHGAELTRVVVHH